MRIWVVEVCVHDWKPTMNVARSRKQGRMELFWVKSRCRNPRIKYRLRPYTPQTVLTERERLAEENTRDAERPDEGSNDVFPFTIVSFIVNNKARRNHASSLSC